MSFDEKAVLAVDAGRDVGAAADHPRDAAPRPESLEARVPHPLLIQRPNTTADDDTTPLARDSETLAKFLQ